MYKISESKKGSFIHTGFEIGLLIKGIDGLLEIIGGFLLLYFNPARLSRLTNIITQHELSEDPNDYVANTLIAVAGKFSISEQNFGIFYLMTHGLIKCIIILLLWRRKLWAYPLSIIALILFIAYQLYRIIIAFSVLLIALTLFDAVMIVFTYLEYKRMKFTGNFE